MNGKVLGLWIVVAGRGLAMVRLLVWSGLIGWFGRLPGDLRLEREGVRVYAPSRPC